ncbi:MAG TPA: discoidin domain-containing protein, partial [Armatimonadota bacterium]|nr:discoidin domain-containing protein [Armatimonadota bacterium]
LVVDGLTASVEAAALPSPPLRAELDGELWAEPGAVSETRVVVTNFRPAVAPAKVELSIRRDPALFSGPVPDPVHGSDHALGARSWTEADGKRIEEGSLTDGHDWTAAETEYRANHYKEAFQFVDLGRERRITHLAYRAGDANWVWKVDVAGSADGRDYQPVPSLQGVDLHGKWGDQPLPLHAPFSARYLRLRYHADGKASNILRMPVALSVYDGTADEKWELPSAGTEVARVVRSLQVPPRSFTLASLAPPKPLPTGAYLLAARVEGGGIKQVLYRHLFVLPAPRAGLSAESLFGLNSSTVEHTPPLQRLGIGWVRFENMKWPMTSPEPGVYRFDGSVGPWYVDHDRIMEGYAAQGLNVLPFLFLTADYATSAPKNIDRGRWSSYPPRDNALMAEFVFQTVARYGSVRHPAAELKSPDKRSG